MGGPMEERNIMSGPQFFTVLCLWPLNSLLQPEFGVKMRILGANGLQLGDPGEDILCEGLCLR